MSLSDSTTTAALSAAQDMIRTAAASIVVEVANSLLTQMKSAATYRERGQVAFAQIHILESRELFLASFATALRDSVADDVAAKTGGPAADKAKTDWQSISLVGEEQIEERISFGRIGQLISHRCEAELRELDGYMSALLRTGWADPERNPLRGQVLGLAIHKAIEKITDEPDTQKIFAREVGQAMSHAMPACYQAIIADLKQRGVRPSDVSMRPPDGFNLRAAARPSASAPVPGFEETRKAWEASWQGRIGADNVGSRDWERSILGRHADPIQESGDPESSAGLLDRMIRGALPGSFAAAQGGVRGPGTGGEADVELMSLLRRLNGGAASARGELDPPMRGSSGYGPYTRDGEPDFALSTRSGVPLGAYQVQAPSSGLSGLMAANLIRAHRDELMKASRGKLDHLVIEVVSSLFDQILSDSRVPPQMARQIARLQLPVLRAALVDSSFFSSRRHPVRRFINRVASLACAFDTFETGPARELLERVSGLVKEIVDGDFDQLEVYDAKLLELERFVAEQTHAEIRESSAAATLRGKELEWRVQQRFSQKLFAALDPLALPAFVRDFLAGVWGQAIVMASRRDGAEGTHAQSLRRTGVGLVTSIQPKRSLEERKHFVVSLPGLMSELTEGMKFVEWPQAAQDEFFGQLISQHSGSLKGTARSDLDHNMMVRTLEAAFRLPVPSPEEASAEPEPEPTQAQAPVVEQRFSAAEGQAIGLISEGEIDWSRHPANEARAAHAKRVAEEAALAASAPAAAAGDAAPVDIALGGIAAGETPFPVLLDDRPDETSTVSTAATVAAEEPVESPELAPGRQLRDHLQLGFSYQLNLKDQWEKVRLTYMSPGRTLFLFAHGVQGRETISMTARTLARLCDGGRIRAFENAFLIDRATQRARQQLATIGRPGAALAPARG
ncbi:MAG: DUF1631 family protein [Caldimonas sp.]